MIWTCSAPGLTLICCWARIPGPRRETPGGQDGAGLAGPAQAVRRRARPAAARGRAGGGPGTAGGGPGGPAAGPVPAGFAGRVTLTVPLTTVQDRAARPGEIAGIGPVDPDHEANTPDRYQIRASAVPGYLTHQRPQRTGPLPRRVGNWCASRLLTRGRATSIIVVYEKFTS